MGQALLMPPRHVVLVKTLVSFPRPDLGTTSGRSAGRFWPGGTQSLEGRRWRPPAEELERGPGVVGSD